MNNKIRANPHQVQFLSGEWSNMIGQICVCFSHIIHYQCVESINNISFLVYTATATQKTRNA